MSRAVIVACLLGIFLISNLAITAGYYNTLLGFDFMAVQWVYESLPVFKVATFLSLLLPLNAVIAFFTSRGSYRAFRQEFMVLSYITPFFIIFFFLPGELDKPDFLQLNMTVMLVLTIAPQLLFSRILAPQFWRMGGREIDT